MNEYQAESEYSKINEELKAENPQLLLDTLSKIREEYKKKERFPVSSSIGNYTLVDNKGYGYDGQAVPDAIEQKMKDQLRILLERAGETKQEPQVNYIIKEL